MRRKIILIVFSVLLTGLISLQAQEKPQTVDSAKVKEILHLLKISGTSDYAYLIIDDVIKNYQQYIKNIPEGYWDQIIQTTDIKPFMNSIVVVYDKRFTIDEIRELITFFESPVGNKWSIELKDMNEEVMTQANKFGQNLFDSVNQKLIKDGYILNQQGNTQPYDKNQQKQPEKK